MTTPVRTAAEAIERAAAIAMRWPGDNAELLSLAAEIRSIPIAPGPTVEEADAAYWDAYGSLKTDTDRIVAALDRLTRATEAVALATALTAGEWEDVLSTPPEIVAKMRDRLGLGEKEGSDG